MAVPRLLFVNRAQFGYHIDSYKYCQYLKNCFVITYICWDYGFPKIKYDGIEVRYVSRKSNKLLRYCRFLRSCFNEIRIQHYHLVFFQYFLGVSMIPILSRRAKVILDIRTGSIGRNKLKNVFADWILGMESLLFSNISIISVGLAQKLRIRKYHILPLGGECFSSDNKSFHKIHLLYVGTLQGRNILDCVKGFHYYLDNILNMTKDNYHFTIIGSSPDNELEEIETYIKQNCLQDFITTTGYIHNDLLSKFFKNANIGISYIPQTSFFDNQPPTKTYEYLLSGIPVICTRTKENLRILKSNCGVLIEDNIESFILGLTTIVNIKNHFHSEEIRNLYKEYLWENIVSQNFKPYIFKVLKD